jgi:rsbT co-antagonist protein RsbR
VPIVRLWAGILAVPVIGTLDTMRADCLMDSLLSRIAEEAPG